MGCSLCADFELSDQVTVISPPQKKKAMQGRTHISGPYIQRKAVGLLKAVRSIARPGRTFNAGPYDQRRVPYDQCTGRKLNASNEGPYAQRWAVRSMQGRTLNAGPYAPCRAVRSLKSRMVTEEPNGPFGQCRAVRSTRNAGRHIQRMVQCRGCTLNVGGRTLDARGLGHDRSYGPSLIVRLRPFSNQFWANVYC